MGYVLKPLSGKRFLIRVDGSFKIGLGHVFRMAALATALQRGGAKVLFVSLKDTQTKSILKRTGARGRFFLKGNERNVLGKEIHKYVPDVIIFDVLNTNYKLLRRVKKWCNSKLVTFDDLNAGLELADIVVNAIVFHYPTLKARPRARVFKGPNYMVLQPKILSLSKRKRKIPSTVRRVLVAIGGTDTRCLTGRVVKILNSIKKNFQITVHLGPAALKTRELKKQVNSSIHPIKITAGGSFLSQLSDTDLLVCGGGNMLYEAAALGIPAAAIPTEPHERRNVQYWEKCGTALDLGWIKNLEDRRASQTIEALMSDADRRSVMSRRGRKIVDGRGMDRIMNALSEGFS